MANAVPHFIIGYIWARGIRFGTPEIAFAPLGPFVALAFGDASTTRNIVSSAIAFALGFIAFLWLAP